MTFINCWCLGENESYAMWQIYAAKNEGVAIQSTIEGLRNSFTDKAIDIDISKVKYLDFRSRDGINKDKQFNFTENQKNDLLNNFYACKSKEYEFEKEVRAIYRNDKVEDYKELSVELSTLIQKVYINPFAEKWFINLVAEILERYGVNGKAVIPSNIEIQK